MLDRIKQMFLLVVSLFFTNVLQAQDFFKQLEQHNTKIASSKNLEMLYSCKVDLDVYGTLKDDKVLFVKEGDFNVYQSLEHMEIIKTGKYALEIDVHSKTITYSSSPEPLKVNWYDNIVTKDIDTSALEVIQIEQNKLRDITYQLKDSLNNAYTFNFSLSTGLIRYITYEVTSGTTKYNVSIDYDKMNVDKAINKEYFKLKNYIVFNDQKQPKATGKYKGYSIINKNKTQ